MSDSPFLEVNKKVYAQPRDWTISTAITNLKNGVPLTEHQMARIKELQDD